MRKVKVSLIFILIILAGLVFLIREFTSPVDVNDQNPITFSITSGQGTNSIIDNLVEQGLIKNATAAKIYVRLSGNSDFKAGVFTLNKSMSMPEIIRTLNSSGAISEVPITIREGLRVVDVADIFNRELGINADEFKAATNDQAFIDELASRYPVIENYDFNNDMIYKLEGLLAPDTYRFGINATAKDVIETLVAQTNKIYEDHKALFDNSPLTIKEVFTLASMVEAEVHTREQREIVASIFENRIDAGMNLGSDVTTYYGIQVHMGDRELTVNELNQLNAYNTRAPGFLGLPAGPVSSPSLESIEAVLNAPTTDYLFFVNDKNGEIYPSATYAQHQAIIAKLQEDGLWYDDVRE